MAKIQVPLEIEEEHLETLVKSILRVRPIPMDGQVDEEGNLVLDDDDNPIMNPRYTALTHIKKIALDRLAKIATKGAEQLRLDASPVDTSLINSIIEDNLKE